MFYSDLDSTLIFSRRYLPAEIPISCSDYKDGIPICYIANNTNEILQDLLKRNQFVPVTSRNLRQYLRISCFSPEEVEWAVISSGETVLHYGKEYLPYSKLIHVPFDVLTVIEERLNKFNFVFRKMSKYTYLVEEKQNEHILERVEELNSIVNDLEFQALKTKLDSQNPQILISPISFSKGYAVDFIKKQCEDKQVIVSGDSAPDLSMLEIADFGIVNEGMYDIFEIVKNKSNIIIIPNKNFEGSYEIVKKAKEFLEKENKI